MPLGCGQWWQDKAACLLLSSLSWGGGRGGPGVARASLSGGACGLLWGRGGGVPVPRKWFGGPFSLSPVFACGCCWALLRAPQCVLCGTRGGGFLGAWGFGLVVFSGGLHCSLGVLLAWGPVRWGGTHWAVSVGIIWLILPVVICLSQRLSHACLSVTCLHEETADGSLNQL